MSLRQLLADIPQVSHYTCYDLVAEPKPAPLKEHEGRWGQHHPGTAIEAELALEVEPKQAPRGVLLTDDPATAMAIASGDPSAAASPPGDPDPCASVPGAVPRRALNDFLELAEYEDVCSGQSRLRMTQRPYDVRQARLHLRRLRVLLAHPPAPQPSVSVVATNGRELPCVDFADNTAYNADGAGAGSASPALTEAAAAAAQTTPSAHNSSIKGIANDALAQLTRSPDTDMPAGAEDAMSGQAGPEEASASPEALLHSVVEAQEQLRVALAQAPPAPVPVPLRLQSLYSPPSQDAVAAPVTLLRVMQPASAGAKCLRGISVSGWNPPPPSRAVLGDLLYLDVVTLDERSALSAELARALERAASVDDAELLAAADALSEAEAGTVLHITATASGFFVNRTGRGKFDPEPLPGAAANHSSTLVGLLVQASPTFAKAYSDLLKRAADAAASTPVSTLAPWETLFNMSVRPPPSLRAAALGEAVGGGGPYPPSFGGTFASIGEGYAFAKRPWIVDPTGGRASSSKTPWDGAGAHVDSAAARAAAASGVRGRMSSVAGAAAAGGGGGGGGGESGSSSDSKSAWWQSSAVGWMRHRHDLNRSEDELAAAFGMDERGSLRDWNEEYQSCRSLPCSDMAERVVRARALTKVIVDFVEAATRGAQAIALGHVPPLNPTDDPSTFVYVFNSIFFSLGMDETLRRRHRRKRIKGMQRRARKLRAAEARAAQARVLAEAAAEVAARPEADDADIARAAQADLASEEALQVVQAALAASKHDDGLTDAASMVPSNHDLQGVRSLNDVDVPGLHTLLTVVVNIAGRRVVAQSIIPGILQGEQASTLVYGSTDNGKTVASEPHMHSLMRQACERLSIAERIFRPESADAAEGDEPAEAAKPSQAAKPAEAESFVLPERDVDGGVGGPWPNTSPSPLCGPVECKGIVGSDGRRYVLDMVRVTPRDPVYYGAKRARRDERKAKAAAAAAAASAAASTAGSAGAAGGSEEHVAPPPWADLGQGDSDSEDDEVGSCYTALLRPELIVAYRMELQKELEQAAAAEPGAAAAQAAAHGPDASTAAEPGAVTADPKDGPAKSTAARAMLELNVNCFTRFASATGTEEEVARDEKQIRTVGRWLVAAVLPAFVRKMATNAVAHPLLDGEVLTKQMHAAGINVRYLGAIGHQLRSIEAGNHPAPPPAPAAVAATVAAADPKPALPPPGLLELVEAEMVARVARRRLDALIRDDPRTRAAPAVVVAAFLNALLGAPGEPGAAARTTGRRGSSPSGSTSSGSGSGKRMVMIVPGVGGREKLMAGGLDTLSQAAEAVAELNVTRETVWQAIHAGVLKHFGYDLDLWRNGGFDEAHEHDDALASRDKAKDELATAHDEVRAALRAVGAGAPGDSATAELQAAFEAARAKVEAATALSKDLEQAASEEHLRLRRCHRLVLLRRLCHKAGLQVVGRDYKLGQTEHYASAEAATAGDTAAATAGGATKRGSGTGSSSARGGKHKGKSHHHHHNNQQHSAHWTAAASSGTEAGMGAGGMGDPAAAGWSWSGGRVVRGVAEHPFRVSDVAGLVPVVKHMLPASLLRDATRLHVRGRELLAEGRLQEAYQFVQEALLLLYQVCGAAHIETAGCCATLALVLWHAGDKAGAVAQQQRATVLMELLRGVDHGDAAIAHSSLAFFLGGCGEMQAAAVHMRRALVLMDIMGGPSGAETIATWLKLGMIYQDSQHTVMAVACFREALARCAHNPAQAAACLHALAVAHSVGGGFHEALTHERKAHSLLAAALGPEHPRTVEAARRCKQFMRKAHALDTALRARLGDAVPSATHEAVVAATAPLPADSSPPATAATATGAPAPAPAPAAGSGKKPKASPPSGKPKKRHVKRR
jgi:tetratricopeptide (TPR) repeat protein